jgi:hypothetical protein
VTFNASGNTTGAASSGTQFESAITFAGSGIVSVGISNNQVVFSATTPAQTAFVLSNSNGLNWGTNGSTVTGSYTVPTQSNQTGAIYASSQTVGQSSSSTYDARSLSLVGQGIVSAGWSAGSLLVSATTPAQTAFVLSNSNGITFGTNASTVTASYNSTQFAGTNTSFGGTNVSGSLTLNSGGLTVSLSAPAAGAAGTATIYGTGNTFGSSTGTQALSSLIFAGSGAASVEISGGSVIISAPNAAAGNVTFSAAANSSGLGSVIFANSNNVSFGLTTGSQITATATFAQSVQGQTLTVSAANTSYTVPNLSFSNANNVSFSLSNNSQVYATASFPAQTVQTVGIYLSGNTSGAQSSSTFSATALSLYGSNHISIAFSNGSVVFNETDAGQSVQTYNVVSMGTSTFGGGTGGASTSFSTGTIGFYAGSNITLSQTSNSIIVYGTSGGGAGGGIAAGMGATGTTLGTTGTASTGTIYFQASGNITASQSTAAGSLSTIWFSVPAQSVVPGHALGVSNTGTTLGNTGTGSTGTVVFAASGAITASQSTAAGISTVWFSVPNVITTASYYALGNTIGQSSNTSMADQTVSFSGLGGMSVGMSAGAVVVSAPATSSLVGVSPISVSSNASTISVQPIQMSRYVFPADLQLSGLGVPVNGSGSVELINIPWALTATRAEIFLYQSLSSSATTNTYGQQWSVYMGLYSNDTANNRLVSLSTGSTQTTYTVASNTAGVTQMYGSAIRPISCPLNVNATPGVYFFAVNWSTNTFSSGASTTALNRTISMMGGVGIQSASYNLVADYSVATAVTVNSFFPQGTFTTAAGVLPGSISYSQISMTGAAAQQADLAVWMRAN